MNSFEQYYAVAQAELLRMYGNAIGFLPSLLLFFIVAVGGWGLAVLVRRLVLRLAPKQWLNNLVYRLSGRFGQYFEQSATSPTQLLANVAYYTILLFVFLSLAETLGWHAFSQELSTLLGYLPQLFGAIIILFLGLYIANAVRATIRNAAEALAVPSGRLISIIVYNMLVALIGLTALRQAGIETELLSSNLLLFVGAVLLAAAVSYGVASRDILRNLLGAFYGRRSFALGVEVEIEGHKGRIVELNNQRLVLQLADGALLHLPAYLLSTSKVIVRGENRQTPTITSRAD